MKNINKPLFDQWLVGVTDSEGTFGLYNQNGKWNLVYKITQSNYNTRMLYYIKKQLGVGSIVTSGKISSFFLKNINNINKYIIPIFDKYALLTKKQFNYLNFKQAFLILNDVNKTKQEKDRKLFYLKNKRLPLNYVSSILLNNLSNLEIKSVNEIKNIISKYWLVGFIEAEGSFYLVSKSDVRIVHGFTITQKLEKILLNGIKRILHILTKVVYKLKHNYYNINTTNSRAIENMILYFQNTMKGMKSLEYKIWSRSYNKDKGNYQKLLSIINIIRNMKINKSQRLPLLL